MSAGHLFVISGSSGVGKGTVMKRVMERMPDLQFSVSATSRPPRPGETNGVEYFFVSEDAFKQMIEQGAFVVHRALAYHRCKCPGWVDECRHLELCMRLFD